MKEKLRFALGSVAVMVMAVCLVGAALVGWLRTLAGAVTRTAALAVMEPAAVLPRQGTAVESTQERQADRKPALRWQHSVCCEAEAFEGVLLPARVIAMGPGAPPGVFLTEF